MTETLTPAMLRDWSLPSGADSKYARGDVLVVGGSAGAPGAAMLAGLAALRVGAGRLSLAVADSVAVPVAVAVPESAVIALAEDAARHVSGEPDEALEQALAAADAVVLGPGLVAPEEARALLELTSSAVGDSTMVLLDAFALGVLPDFEQRLDRLRGRIVLTPNEEEAELLLGREFDTLADAVAEIAERYGAVVTCFGEIAEPGGRRWSDGAGQAGLGTSGSGDVLAGAIGGLLARGADCAQAACWGTHLHATSGDRLAARIGPTGYLARELLGELPVVLAELGQRV